MRRAVRADASIAVLCGYSGNGGLPHGIARTSQDIPATIRFSAYTRLIVLTDTDLASVSIGRLGLLPACCLLADHDRL